MFDVCNDNIIHSVEQKVSRKVIIFINNNITLVFQLSILHHKYNLGRSNYRMAYI